MCAAIALYGGILAWSVAYQAASLAATILGWPLVVAKAAASALEVTFLLLPLPVLRGFVTILSQFPAFMFIVPIEKLLRKHKGLGHAAVIFTWLHVLPHIYLFVITKVRRGEPTRGLDIG